MSEYPKRSSHFAHRTFRLMTKVCAAQEIGSDAMLLVAVILHQEDAKRYRGAVTFYNGQLMPILGFTSWNRLDKARKSAVDAGWLHYESGGKRKPGLYWGTIPKHLTEVDDTPIDEGLSSTSIDESEGASGDTTDEESISIVTSGGTSGDKSSNNDVSTSESGCATGEEVEGQAGRKRGASGEPPILSPNPIPKEPVSKKHAGVLSLVSQETLADPGSVLEWFKTASKGKGRILQPTEANKINVVALAQRVICDFNIESPIKVFVACVRDKDFQITGPEEDKAVAAIKLIEQGPPPGRSSDLSDQPKSKDQQLADLLDFQRKGEESKG